MTGNKEAAVPQISEQLAQRVLDMLESGQDFVLAQAPDVIQQLVTWSLYKTLIGVGANLLFLGFGIAAIVAAVRAMNKITDTYKDEDLAIFSLICGFAGVLFASFSAGFLYSNAVLLAQIYFAPKVFLIDYLRQLVG